MFIELKYTDSVFDFTNKLATALNIISCYDNTVYCLKVEPVADTCITVIIAYDTSIYTDMEEEESWLANLTLYVNNNRDEGLDYLENHSNEIGLKIVNGLISFFDIQPLKPNKINI